MNIVDAFIGADFARIIKGEEPRTLLGLSVSKDTQPPTAERRVQELRARLPVERFNDYVWPHCQRAAYEREQIADASPTTDTHWSL